ncbi:tungstate transport system substrate-binding protein [Methylohalomonas lacus]|uniref:Tungstate transport system substrate-binding protein n=1 Tax=Methylohalomonas lacus TaxID=398773 RepID=A0AAE3L1J8_9GAMM|nr:substrate-binding domain-containing protein [Methylohalomonas lacus]MCS3903685.1 tungstate transport system substrate-binding protein [Methylohalomonas lacus]
MNSLKITLVSLLLVLPLAGQAQERLRMATTTSTENSGLLAELNPVFEAQYDAVVDVIAVGTGKALKLGENGDVDIVFVHAPQAEQKFVEAGYGVDRTAVMHNDFVIIGPAEDPAGVKQTDTAAEALATIRETRATFVSRGDDSGTHKKEMQLWDKVGIEPAGDWYLAIGQGMGAVLQVAEDRQAYALTDRGTYIAYKDKIELEIASEGDKALYNPYHIIAVNPVKHSHVKYDLATDYIDFVTSEEGQRIIKDYRMQGQQLFYPDAMPGI